MSKAIKDAGNDREQRRQYIGSAYLLTPTARTKSRGFGSPGGAEGTVDLEAGPGPGDKTAGATERDINTCDGVEAIKLALL